MPASLVIGISARGLRIELAYVGGGAGVLRGLARVPPDHDRVPDPVEGVIEVDGSHGEFAGAVAGLLERELRIVSGVVAVIGPGPLSGMLT